MPAATRPERVTHRERNPKWKLPPYRVDMADCISCLACIRHCPPPFGAVAVHGIDVIIVPELCSGCGACLPPVCPVDCIRVDVDWRPTPERWWSTLVITMEESDA